MLGYMNILERLGIESEQRALGQLIQDRGGCDPRDAAASALC